MKTPIYCVLLATAFSCIPAQVLAQSKTILLCTGEHRDKCRSNPDVHERCPQQGGRSPDEVAKQACTWQTESGPKMSPYQVMQTGTWGGNKCGYALYRIQCQ